MHVLDGIAYADELRDGIKVEAAKAVNDMSMLVTFSSGETRLFDASQLVAKPAFEALGDYETFQSFDIDRGVVTWDRGNIDIAPETMYKMSFPYEQVA